jgi:uncharacterized protein
MIKIRMPKVFFTIHLFTRHLFFSHAFIQPLFILLGLMSFNAQAETYFECNQASDPLLQKVCASPATVQKASRFNASYQLAFAESKTYQEIKPAVKIKNNYRSEVAGCRAIQEVYTTCIDTALDNAIAALNNEYQITGDPLTLEPNRLKESAHQNATSLKDQARKIPMDCLKEEAKKSDDNVSPASDIGASIARTCKQKANEFVAFANDSLILWDVLNLIPRMNNDQLNDLSERSFGADAATKIVLETRVEKYKASSKKTAPKKKKRSTSSSK